MVRPRYWKRQIENPLKRKVWSLVLHAMRTGRLIKSPFCQLCLGTHGVEAHHEDYAKPFDVVWLCRRCHTDITPHVRSAPRLQRSCLRCGGLFQVRVSKTRGKGTGRYCSRSCSVSATNRLRAGGTGGSK
jgi:hypothetical protein